MSTLLALVTSQEVEQALVRWLPEQRWFDGTGRALASAQVVRSHVFAAPAAPDGALGALVVVRARDVVGADAGSYLLVVGACQAQRRPGGEVIARQGGGVVYDALQDPLLIQCLLQLMADGQGRDGAVFSSEPPGFATPEKPMPVRALGAEQSNTSVTIGDQFILKIFRRVSPAPSPDLVVHRMLVDQDSAHVPPLLGAAWDEASGGTYATVQEFLPKAQDGWAAALASVRRVLAPADARPAQDFAARARGLGGALASVHGDLARAAGQQQLEARHYRQLSQLFLRRLTAAVDGAPQLAPYAGRLHEQFSAVARLAPSAHRSAQLSHGDLHLGQTLHTSEGWILLDFEGEPLADHTERSRHHSPLRDVAAMLRSFDYAAHHELTGTVDCVQALGRAREWVELSRRAFLDGYGAHRGEYTSGDQELLRAYELDKAVYEVLYETRHRPSWAWIPLRAIEQSIGVSV
ncbi:maltokinase N-terminal cap-like domain-containing protein [Streptomyces sp. NBC_00009]|uniref:maltokinase N-terminal cap-like domain-containing protein n=1 Tax=Streptomyces sp. NBC_00009 TaxID=2975620 RepID=UPI00324C9AF0